jgi:pyruvate,water dikinase
MLQPWSWFKRRLPETLQGVEAIRSVFSKFRRIQTLNTRVLEIMARMEQTLGGEFIFDRAFLESSVRELSRLTYQVAYSLNAMSDNGYPKLLDRFQDIQGILEDILEGGFGSFSAQLTLPYGMLGWEMEPLAGLANVCLAEARSHLEIPATDGFAVTAMGCRRFLEQIGSGTPMGPDSTDGPSIPQDLETAICEELSHFAIRSRPDAIRVRTCAAGDLWETPPEVQVVTGISAREVLSACRQVLLEYAVQCPGEGQLNVMPVALAVQAFFPADVQGVITTAYFPRLSSEVFQVTAKTSEGRPQERYLLRRVYPFDLIETQIFPKAAEKPLFADVLPLSSFKKGFLRGSGLMAPSGLKTLAEYAMAIERVIGCMAELHWVKKSGGDPVVVDIRPVSDALDEAGTSCEMAESLSHAQVIATGGETVQTGIAAGAVVHIHDDQDLTSFPYGAVAVARAASPRLSPVLRRASAIVTELGTSFGHLATIAREYRVPAIFGLKDALQRMENGMEVTLDAGERSVYRGIVEPLLSCRACRTDLLPSDPEYVALRRLLRWITPLAMIDPEAETFLAQNCQSYHDIIHFAHEKSVQELLRLQDRGRSLASSLPVRKMKLDIPIALYVMDIGNGLSAAGQGPVTSDQVLSVTFRAFLQGLTSKNMWKTAPASIRLKDILSGMGKPYATWMNPSGYAGSNHAIVGDSYMNVGLRLGYHFCVIDSFIGDSVNQNYIYFRFVGGLADEKRRGRRAQLIRTILDAMGFKVTLQGDLVVATFKIAPPEAILGALTRIGALTGFTRQLDIAMVTDERISQLAAAFVQDLAHNQPPDQG